MSRRPVKDLGVSPSCTVKYDLQVSNGEDTKEHWVAAQSSDMNTAHSYEQVQLGDMKPTRKKITSYSLWTRQS